MRHKRKTIAKLLIDKGASTEFLADESNQSLISANVLLMITAKDEKDLKFSKDKTAKGPQIRYDVVVVFREYSLIIPNQSCHSRSASVQIDLRIAS